MPKVKLSPELIAYNKAKVLHRKKADIAAKASKDLDYARCHLQKVGEKFFPKPKYIYTVTETKEKHPHNGKIAGIRITRILENAEDYINHHERYGNYQDYYHRAKTPEIPHTHEASLFIYHAGGVLFEQSVTVDDRRRSGQDKSYRNSYVESILLNPTNRCSTAQYKAMISTAKIPKEFLLPTPKR